MDKKLQKNIEKRHKEEQKQREANQKQRIKDMKKLKIRRASWLNSW